MSVVGAAIALAVVSLFVEPWAVPREAAAASVQASGEFIAAIQVHGNVLTSEADILKLSGITVGEPFVATTIDEVSANLRRGGRFKTVEVRKRFGSISDPAQVVVVIIVDEGPVRLEVPDDETQPIVVVRRGGLANLMLVPIFFAEDGYGATAGVRLSFVNVSGEEGRLSFPVTIGGERRAAVELDRPFPGGPLTQFQAGVATQRVHNPAFDEDDQREVVWGRVERAVGPVRIGARFDWQQVSFGGVEDDVASGGVDVSLDTRRDPIFPRNAVLLSMSLNRRDFGSGTVVTQGRWQASGYVGLIGQSVIRARLLREDATGALPPPFQPMLGGSSNLRGFRRGIDSGDNLVAGTLELLLPLSSPLSVGRLGLNVFADAGTVYAHDEQLVGQRFRSGFGAGAWLTLAAFRLNVSVARGRHDGVRVHFTAGVGR